jgi:hypothetical protein
MHNKEIRKCCMESQVMCFLIEAPLDLVESLKKCAMSKNTFVQRL